MGNPTPIDQRFNKPSAQSLIDLINFTNHSYIKYGEVIADQVTPILGQLDQPINTTVRIRLPGATENAPYSILRYGRLDIGDYVGETELFHYLTMADSHTLLDQLRLLTRVWLNEDECSVVIAEKREDQLRPVTFIPNDKHPVWTGQLTVFAGDANHLLTQLKSRVLDGFVLDQLNIA